MRRALLLALVVSGVGAAPAGAITIVYGADAVQLGPAVPKLGRVMSVGTAFSAALPLPDGSTIVVGKAGTADATDYFQFSSAPMIVVRVLFDGTLDRSFGINGVARPDPPADLPPGFDARQLFRQADGRIVVVGEGSQEPDKGAPFEVMRLNPDGSRDTTFASGATATVPDLQVTCEGCQNAALASDGSILLTGQTGRYGRGRDETPHVNWVVARLTANGQLDPTYGNSGLATVPAHAGQGFDVAALADGSALVSGGSQASDDYGQIVAKLTPSGAIDPRFNGGGPIRPARGNGAIHAEPDGSFEVYGAPTLGGPAVLARYDATGRLADAYADHGVARGFDPFAGNPRIYSAPNGALLLAGTPANPPPFSTRPNTTGLIYLVRLGHDGKVDPDLGGPRGQLTRLGTFATFGPLVQRPDGSLFTAGFDDLRIYFGEGESTAVYQGAYAAVDNTLKSPAFIPTGLMRMTGGYPRHALTKTTLKVRFTASAVGLVTGRATDSVGHLIATTNLSTPLTLLTAPQTRTLTIHLTRTGRRLMATQRRMHIETRVLGRDLTDHFGYVRLDSRVICRRARGRGGRSCRIAVIRPRS